jgi:hypothetical protein
MRIKKLWISTVAIVILFNVSVAFCFLQVGQEIPFEYKIVDSKMSGDCKMLGDIDGDGFLDIVIAGYSMYWYSYPDWNKTLIANSDIQFTTDAELGDIDGDGDLDVIVPDGSGTDNLRWFENPRLGGKLTTSTWLRHTIGTIGDWGKDIELNDFDGDGRLDVATRSPLDAYIFFQNSIGTWNKVQIYHIGGGEGMGSGDVDGDGDRDLVGPGYWLENPKPVGNPRKNTWTKHNIDSMYATIKVLVVDINGDGTNEVVFSNSEGNGELRLYGASNPKSSWRRKDIAFLNRCHTLQAADMDLDGDLDLVAAEMFQNVIIFQNEGNGLTWTKQVLGPGGLHNGVVGDIGNDGDFDIVGSMYIGYPPVKMWENKPLETKVEFTLSPNPVKVGRTITLKGNLKDVRDNPIGNTPVELHVKTGSGPWQLMETLSTNSTGWFQASGTLTSARTYEIAVVYRGSNQYSLSYHIETLTVNP